MPSQFITNQKELLSDLMGSILDTSDKAFFLVGYFYFSGFGQLYRKLADRELKILVGMDIEKGILNKMREFEIIQDVELSRGAIRENYYRSLVQLFNDTDYFDGPEKQEAFRLFLGKIRDGSLEIRKTVKPNHAKLYLFQKKAEFNEGGHYPGALVTGSSNLSISGLTERQEINVVFRDEHYREGRELFDALWKTAVDVAGPASAEAFSEWVLEKIWIDRLPRPFLMYLRVLDETFTIPQSVLRMPAEITRNRYMNLKYQTDAVRQAIRIIERHNGVLIADVVGLGKSIVASAIAHNLGIKTIVVAPPHLKDQWRDYAFECEFNAKVYSSGGLEDALREQSDGGEKLVIVDEAHKFRNEFTADYAALHRLCQGNKVILLSATPFNNRPQDVFAMVKLFQIPARSTLQTVDSLSFRFQEMVKEYRSIDKARKDGGEDANVLAGRVRRLAASIRDLLGPVFIRRSRLDLEAIESYREDLKLQGVELNTVLPPKSLEYDLGDHSGLYAETLEAISPENEESKEGLTGARYKPTAYLKDPERFKKQLLSEFGDANLFLQSQINLAKFMRRLLVKRFESSVHAFRKSLDSLIESAGVVADWYDRLGRVPIYKKGLHLLPDVESLLDLTGDDQEEEWNAFGFEEPLRKFTEKGLVVLRREDLKDDFILDVRKDIDLLRQIRDNWFKNGPGRDPKLDGFRVTLKRLLDEAPERKIVVFTEFSDTADHLGRELKDGFRVFKYSSADAGDAAKRTIRDNFDAGVPENGQKNDFDLLVATDAISEGFNLHRAGVIFNYDVPYNPTRVIQRVGRINRINQKVFDSLHIFNFFPTAAGEKEIRIRQIATLKIHMIHALLGGDTRILSSDEELESFFAEQYRTEWEMQEEKSWDVDFVNLLDRLKLTQPDLVEAARSLPKRCRIRRNAQKGRKGVLVFGKKGGDCAFRFGDGTADGVMLSAREALPLFEAEPGENAEKTGGEFHRIYEPLRKNLFARKSQVAMDTGRRQTLEKIQAVLKAAPVHRDYFEDLLVAARDLDGLPDFFMKRIRALSESTLEQDILRLKEQFPHAYLTGILEKARKIEEGEEIVILAEELP
jgi:SNF2 family DNA or RNA helicase